MWCSTNNKPSLEPYLLSLSACFIINESLEGTQ